MHAVIISYVCITLTRNSTRSMTLISQEKEARKCNSERGIREGGAKVWNKLNTYIYMIQ